MKIILSFIFLTFPLYASVSPSTGYIQRCFVQLLIEPIKQSSAARTLKCNEKISIYNTIGPNPAGEIFYKVKVDKDWGFIEKSYVSTKKVNCFTSKYPEFFQEMVKKGIVEGKDLYLWGELFNELDSIQINVFPKSDN